MLSCFQVKRSILQVTVHTYITWLVLPTKFLFSVPPNALYQELVTNYYISSPKEKMPCSDKSFQSHHRFGIFQEIIVHRRFNRYLRGVSSSKNLWLHWYCKNAEASDLFCGGNMFKRRLQRLSFFNLYPLRLAMEESCLWTGHYKLISINFFCPEVE